MLKFKLLKKDSKLPERATDGAAGFDLYADDRIDLAPGASMLVGTGIAMAIPQGWCGQVNPRSSMACKRIRVGARVIDSDYRGEVMINLHNDGDQVFEIKAGDRIAQIIFLPIMTDFVEVDDLDSTERGEGGFGSTGR